MHNIGKTGRIMKRHRNNFNSIAFVKHLFSYHHHSLPVLGAIFLCIPVLHGCESMHSKDAIFIGEHNMSPVKVAVQGNTNSDETFLDILVFRNDRTNFLECYQRVAFREDGPVSIASMEGEKTLMACTAAGNAFGDWMWVSSISSLSDAWSDLEDETAEAAAMSGRCTFKAGGNADDTVGLTLRRLSCEILLRSLRCDFSGRPYAGEKLTDIRVYLTNVNASCWIWDDSGHAHRIINQGRAVEADMDRFKDRDLIYRKIDKDVGKKEVRTDIRLRCYPNISSEEGIGTPFTRLVIQGNLDGSTWYWPIDINRGNGQTPEGVEANCSYRYDIVLTRKGSADPDTAVRTDAATIRLEVDKWEEKEEYTVLF